MYTNGNFAHCTTSAGTILTNTATIDAGSTHLTTNPAVTQVLFNITTEIDHGTITEDKYDLQGGRDYIIDFKPEEGYYLTDVVIDGQHYDLSYFDPTGQSKVNFTDLSTDHDIKVYTEPIPEDPDPVKKVDKTTTKIGEKITYTITDVVPEFKNPKMYYTKYIIKDAFPKGLDNLGLFMGDGIKVVNELGQEVLGERFGSKISINDGTATIEIDSDTESGWLLSPDFYGHTYTITVSFTVKPPFEDVTTEEGTFLKNQASVETGSKVGTGTSNEVTTEVLFDVTTSIDNGTITENLTDLKGGQDVEVEFTPQKGYYVSKVTVDGEPTEDYDKDGNTYTFENLADNHNISVETQPMKAKITVNKKDAETTTPQGNAKFEGAQYTIYKDELCTQVAEVLTLDASGTATSNELTLVENTSSGYVYHDNYYVKETRRI